jgi:hypothetical protein
MGVFYELVKNAPPPNTSGSQTITGDLSQQRLDDFWKAAPPAPPWSIEWGVGGALFEGDFTSRERLLSSAALGARVDMTVAHDEPGFGLRLTAVIPWTRDVPVGPTGSPGFAAWTRLGFGIGPRYRVRLGRHVYGDVSVQLMLASVYAKGHNFDQNFEAWGVDVGPEAGARVGWRAGHLAFWAGITGAYFVGKHLSWWPNLELQVDRLSGGAGHPFVPAGDLAGVVGLSWFFW